MARPTTLAAGRLRHHVELQREIETQDPVTGEIVKSWATVARVWAAVEPLSVRSLIAASAEQSEVRGYITIRQRDDVVPFMRVLHRGMAYQVLGVLADAQSGLEYQTLPVSQGVRLT